VIGNRIGDNNEQLQMGTGYDHCWVLNRTTHSGVELATTLWEPVSGRCMEVFTDQPGIQFYSGNFFDEGSYNGKYGRPIRYRESLALETQKYPDSPNHPHFPSSVLRPGETYTHTCVYKFSTK
jgi:aldose 1-epimerase